MKEREKLEEAAAKMEDNHKKLLEERKKESLRVRTVFNVQTLYSDQGRCVHTYVRVYWYNVLQYNVVHIYVLYVCTYVRTYVVSSYVLYVHVCTYICTYVWGWVDTCTYYVCTYILVIL